jgi:SAM-dependent methyltransferase
VTTRRTPIKNQGGLVSPYLAKWAPQPRSGELLRALDVPCGRGRHAFHLATLGYDVVAIDNDPRQIAELERGLGSTGQSVRTILSDANTPLPVESHSFDLVVTTHFVSAALFDQLPTVLRSGGLFIYESFNAHGENWRALPKPGAIREQLRAHFDLVDYRERPAGPPDVPAAVVNAVARLR